MYIATTGETAVMSCLSTSMTSHDIAMTSHGIATASNPAVMSCLGTSMTSHGIAMTSHDSEIVSLGREIASLVKRSV